MYGISYWAVPIFSGCVWLAMLLGMLLWWIVVKHHQHLNGMSDGQTIAYISDIGATSIQPLFIAMGSVTVITFNLAFITERWLRHRGRLVRNDSGAQKILSVCSMIAAMIGGVGLILLTCLNDVKHHTAHDICLVIFIGMLTIPSIGYIVSAIFICAEYQRLGIHHREYRHLRISFWIKLVFIFVELGLAIAFGVLTKEGESKTSLYNPAAVVEWTISLIYTFYVWSFAFDFIPAVVHKDGFGNKYESRETEVEMATETQQDNWNRAGVASNTPAFAHGNGAIGRSAEPVAPSRNF